MAFPPLLLLLALICVLAACGGPSASPQARATQTAAAQATQTAQSAQATRAAAPVWVDLAAQETGSLATQTAKLTITATVTNRSAAPILIWHPCNVRSVDLSLFNAKGKIVWFGQGNDNCLVGVQTVDEPAIPSDGSRTWTQVADLSGRQDLVPETYQLRGAASWYQGTSAQFYDNQPLPAGQAQGQVNLTLQ